MSTQDKPLLDLVAGILKWSEPEVVHTKRGERSVRSGSPTAAFWGLWRADKDALEEAKK